MSLVTAAPELMTSAATDLANIGSTINAAHMAAATPTVAVIPAAADEVSSSIAHLFSQHAQAYQALAGQAATFHEQFVRRLTSSARSYASAEAANAALLQPPTASAGSVVSATAPAQNLLIDFLNGIQSSIDNALGSILWFFLAPVVVPIFDAVLTAVLTAILEATLKALL